MTLQTLALPMAAAALLALTGCPVPEEASKAEEALATREQKPKTTAELLVGKWKQVSTDGVPTSPNFSGTNEYRENGIFIIHSQNKGETLYVQRHTYVVNGDTLHEMFDKPCEHIQSYSGSPFEADRIIELVTEDRLIITTWWHKVNRKEALQLEEIHGIPADQIIAQVGKEYQKSEYRRIVGK